MGEKKEGIASSGRNINNWVLNREETAYNFPASSEEGLITVPLFFGQICNVVAKLTPWEKFKVA